MKTTEKRNSVTTFVFQAHISPVFSLMLLTASIWLILFLDFTDNLKVTPLGWEKCLQYNQDMNAHPLASLYAVLFICLFVCLGRLCFSPPLHLYLLP